jgi:multidrug efflux pump subunit AcrB
MSDPFNKGQLNEPTANPFSASQLPSQEIADDRDYTQFLKRKFTKITLFSFVTLAYLSAPLVVFLSGATTIAIVMIVIPLCIFGLFWLMGKVLGSL